MQFKVPQNVQREDQIVSFLTLKHLIILSIGGGLAYSIYIILAKNYFWEVWAPPVTIVSLLTLAIAFLKINDIPFLQWILLQIEFMINCQKRSWQKMDSDVFISLFNESAKKLTKIEKKANKKIDADQKIFNNLNELTNILDHRGQK